MDRRGRRRRACGGRLVPILRSLGSNVSRGTESARAAALVAIVGLATLIGAPGRLPAARLSEALTFHAPFDGKLDASFALGDPRLYSAESRKDAARAVAGAPADAIRLAPGEGRQGDAARITLKSSPFVFFKGERNIAYRPRDWSGTVSVWMRLDPDRDLAPGYSDPLIITPRAWNDAAMFVDFTRDDVPRRFRFAGFADRQVWDPGAASGRPCRFQSAPWSRSRAHGFRVTAGRTSPGRGRTSTRKPTTGRSPVTSTANRSGRLPAVARPIHGTRARSPSRWAWSSEA